MKIIWTIAAATLASTSLSASSPGAAVQALAGRYSDHFRNGDVDGDHYWSDDVVEIVPVDAGHAYFRASLQFFNGHVCSLYGIARAEGATLDYHAGKASYAPECHMTLSHSGKWLKLDDHGGTCKSSCGARGGYAGDGLPWSSRRAITYLPKLRGSEQYRSALAEWRAEGGR